MALRSCSRTLRALSSIARAPAVLSSRQALVLPRYASALATKWGVAEVEEDEFESITISEGESEATSAVGKEQPEFETLRGRVSDATLKAIMGQPLGNLTHMSAVQAAVFPLLPDISLPYDARAPTAGKPRDLLVKARTGTGKTLGFLVPAIEARLRELEGVGKKAVADMGLTNDPQTAAKARRIFAHTTAGTLIISPTRELATQIANEAIKLSTYQDGFQVQLFVGGNSKREQMRNWARNRRDIVVATPGRLRDLLESEPDVAEGLKDCKMLVLDEADTLLDMGFRDDIDAISKAVRPTPERQTFLFSATVSPAIKQVALATLDKNHKFINCVSDSASPVHAHVPQYHTILPDASHQIPHLLKLIAHDQLTNPGKSKIMVFLPTTKQTQLFATLLRELAASALPAGRNAEIYEIHSKKNMESRTNASDRFRKDRSGASVLVTSDVSARGVDYPGVTRIIQIGIPSSTEVYIHRIGRTGRGGSTTGRGDLVLLPWEMGFVKWQLTDVPMKPITVNALSDELSELTATHDENPAAFFPASAPNGRFKTLRTQPQPYAPKLAGMPAAITNLLTGVDEEAIRETMTAMLGYYFPKTTDIRIGKDAVVEGCKAWTTQAVGLPVPPYISPRFLEKLGFSGGGGGGGFGRQRGGFGVARSGQSGGSGKPWERRNSWNSDSSGGGSSFQPRSNYASSGRREESSFGRRENSFGGQTESYGRSGNSFVDRDRNARSFSDRGQVSRSQSYGDRRHSGDEGW